MTLETLPDYAYIFILTSLQVLILTKVFIPLMGNVIIGINRATEYESAIEGSKDERYIIKETRSKFWFVRFYCLKWFGDSWMKTICGCPKCMSTFHSTYSFALFYLVLGCGNSVLILFYPLYWFALSGFAHALNMKISKDEQ